eukprot:2187598-Rhodomonas_salina.2
MKADLKRTFCISFHLVCCLYAYYDYNQLYFSEWNTPMGDLGPPLVPWYPDSASLHQEKLAVQYRITRNCILIISMALQ